MKTLINIFAAIGFLGVITVTPIMLIALLLSGGDEVLIENDYVSPGGAFKVVEYIEQGGGAAGYCYKRISILPSTSDNSAIEPDHDYFISASCGAEYLIQWVSDEELVVSLPQESTWGARMHLHPERYSGQISLNFNP